MRSTFDTLDRGTATESHVHDAKLVNRVSLVPHDPCLQAAHFMAGLALYCFDVATTRIHLGNGPLSV